ncbi:MAG: sigma-54-dependent Fis family transcriptional regulator [Myxococcales bacterium]|nr:sigma-54-dependent Fis family transcriptional regulator [Myxococcales bacterium]
MQGRVLLIDDDRALCELLAEGLGRRGWSAEFRQSGEAGLAALAAEEFDVVVTDLAMPGIGGLAFCERVVANRPDVPVIVLTAYGSLETAVAAIRAGAYDFISKPVELDDLALAVGRAAQHRALRDEVRRLRRALDQNRGYEELVGDSAPMREVYALLDRVADTETSVLVTGESGTGKELVARALHRRSRRRDRPFVAVSCAAIPETLLESELFGCTRGAFTGAREDRPGLFVQADGGTLFLDEVGELPLGLQPKLLRALQERTVRPLGGSADVPFDVRLVTATNRDLEAMVEERTFREDLFFRIHVVHIHVPPLRTRGSDVLLLAQQFLEACATRSGKPVRSIAPAAAEKLLAYAWPGNVRELQNCIERAVALTAFDRITPDDLPEKIRNYRPSHVVVAGHDPNELPPLEEVERRYILRVLEATAGNRTLAAQVLGVDRKTLYRKLQRYGDAPDRPGDAEE